MEGCIYKIENKMSGKKYIGQTVQKPERRWQSHKCSKIKSYIGRAIKKHGVNNFDFTVIFKLNSEVKEDLINTLNLKEQEYIIENNCISPNGYNLQSGGKNYFPSFETIEKMRQAKIGKKQSKETIKKRIKKQYKKVKCIDTDENFNFIREAARKKNICESSISMCCSGKRKTAGGFRWEYA